MPESEPESGPGFEPGSDPGVPSAETQAESRRASSSGTGATASGTSTGERIRAALRRPSRGQAVVGLLVGVLMFAAVTQVRQYSAGNVYSGLRQSDLVQALNGLQAATSRADSEIARLTSTRDRLRNASQRRAAALQQARQELSTLAILAGTVPVHGPGIRITVLDPTGHYQVNHLLDGIEELRDAGAEAIAMNGKVRIVAQTSFADADGGIDVDGQLLTQPYELDVIGNPETLSTALDFPGGFKDDVRLDQGRTRVVRVADLRIAVTRPLPSPDYATPDQGSGSSGGNG